MSVVLRQSLALSKLTTSAPLAFIAALPLRSATFFTISADPLRAHRRPANHRYPVHNCQPYATIASSPRRARKTNQPQRKTKTKSKTKAAPTPTTTNKKNVASTELPTTPTQATLIAHIKQKASQNAPRKITSAVSDAEYGTGPWGQAGVRPDATVYNTAIRALIRLQRPDLAGDVYACRVEARSRREVQDGNEDGTALHIDGNLAAAVIRSALRAEGQKRPVRAQVANSVFENVVEECRGILQESPPPSIASTKMVTEAQPPPGESTHEDENDDGASTPMSEKEDVVTGVERDVPRLSAAIASIAAASLGAVHTTSPLRPHDAKRATRCIMLLDELAARFGPLAAPPITTCNELIRVFGKAHRLGSVFDVLKIMTVTGVDQNVETYEFLANAAVRQVSFVTGAVDMASLPPPLAVEVAFVGRSNVGKSSLVNMLCNRKALAYVSGRPGKTQQFNYFVVNERDQHSRFHIVDMPGVGYAKVPRDIQMAWLRFMEQYFRQRTSLSLVFHLVDGRHGALADDEMLMQEMGKLKGAFRYVVVLTKMDKMYKQKTRKSVVDTIREMLVRCGCGDEVPIVATSAESKLGRGDMWWHMQEALRLLQPTDNEMWGDEDGSLEKSQE